jgi:hypothetical protein
VKPRCRRLLACLEMLEIESGPVPVVDEPVNHRAQHFELAARHAFEQNVIDALLNWKKLTSCG